MPDDGVLAGALRIAMRALTADIEPSQRLLAEIAAIGLDRRSALAGRAHAGLRRGARGLLVVLPVPVVGVIAGVLILFTGATVAPSAFALLGNGNIRVTIGQLIGVRAANAQLRRLGVGTIAVVPMSASCQRHPSVTYMVPASLSPSPRITLTPRTVVSGWTIVLAAAKLGHDTVQIAVGRFRHHRIPRCVSLYPPPAGTGARRPTAAEYAPLIRWLKAAAAAVRTG